MTAAGAERVATIDLAAIRANVATLAALVGATQTMAVVKANGYGHGAVEVARAALDGGADWLGVADLAEAAELREAGIDAPVLAWLHTAGADFAGAVTAGVDIGVSSVAQLEQVAAAVPIGSRAFVQVKLDTGLSRNGAAEAEWDALFKRAAQLEHAGVVKVRGVFSHLANAAAAADAAALSAFTGGVARAHAAGLEPELVHLASTAAAIRWPEARFSLVRLGIGIYGLSPYGDSLDTDDDDDVSAGRLSPAAVVDAVTVLRPAMTLRSRVAAVRRVVAGAGVSYGYTWTADAPTTLVLVPLGYADGLPRAASSRAEVSIGGNRYPVRGRIAMDQLVVDVGDSAVAVGDEVVLFGDPTTGNPSADDWARAAGTINYEIVTRLGGRVTRHYVDSSPTAGRQG